MASEKKYVGVICYLNNNFDKIKVDVVYTIYNNAVSYLRSSFLFDVVNVVDVSATMALSILISSRRFRSLCQSFCSFVSETVSSSLCVHSIMLDTLYVASFDSPSIEWRPPRSLPLSLLVSK